MPTSMAGLRRMGGHALWVRSGPREGRFCCVTRPTRPPRFESSSSWCRGMALAGGVGPEVKEDPSPVDLLLTAEWPQGMEERRPPVEIRMYRPCMVTTKGDARKRLRSSKYTI